MPVLGICFGAQALARELGGTVMRTSEPEVGWVHVDTNAPGLIPSGPWFQWHFDRFTPPPAATEIARNAAASQAFRVDRSLGMQFHPEVTPEILERWLSDDGGKSAKDAGADPDTLRSATLAQLPEARQRAYALIDAFLAPYAPSEFPGFGGALASTGRARVRRLVGIHSRSAGRGGRGDV